MKPRRTGGEVVYAAVRVPTLRIIGILGIVRVDNHRLGETFGVRTESAAVAFRQRKYDDNRGNGKSIYVHNARTIL